MSGGHFHNVEFRLAEVVREIERLIEVNDADPTLGFSPYILSKFQETIIITKRAAAMITRVDYLVEGDDGEETFLERWEKEGL